MFASGWRLRHGSPARVASDRPAPSMMKRVGQWRHWESVRGLLLVLVVFIAVRAFQTRDLASGVAPQFSAYDVNGKMVALSDYRGRPVVLHFWATWCGVCRAVEHNIKAVASNTPVVTVASLSGTTHEVRSYAHDHGVSFPIVDDASGALAKRFAVSAFPTTFVIDSDGTIRHAEVGYTTELGLRVRMWFAAL